VFVLIHLLDESGQHIAREIHSQDKIVAVETMIKELADSTTSAILYNVTRREDLHERNSKSRVKLRKNYARLTRLCADDPDELESASRLYASASGWMEQQDKAIASSPQDRMSAFFAIPGFTAAQQLLVMRPEGAARVILDKEQKVLTVQPKLRQQSIVRMQILILFGLAVHISITVFLANFFAKYISQRLENVLKNTLKLGARLPLDPPLRGTDEIADLDHALHETASEILEFEKFKQQLVAVVSHELRTPLTSVQGTLTLLEAGALGEYSEKSKAEIALAQASLKQLIDLINNLLLLERLEAGSQLMKQNEIDIGHIIVDVLDLQEETIEKKEIKVDCVFDELPMLGDWDKLFQVFEILIETCLMRVPSGETLKIVGSIDNQDNIELKLFDSGPRLSSARAASYFDRTRDIDPSEGSKGRILHLALAQAIVVAHKGTLTAVSDSKSSHFELKLPMRSTLE
jgi:signal transduction histidine kinase